MDEHTCACQGLGWAESAKDVYVECPVHYEGQLHPDTLALLLDEPDRMVEEERKSRLKYRIKDARSKITGAQEKLRKMELELINRTPTVRAMPAVKYEPTVEEISDSDIIYLEGDSI
jgi:hypothetical protein